AGRPAPAPQRRARRCYGRCRFPVWPPSRWTRASTAVPAGAADPDAPDLRALRQVVPADLAGLARLQLEAQRLGVAVVEQDEGLAGLQRVDRLEDPRVAAGVRDGAGVEVVRVRQRRVALLGGVRTAAAATAAATGVVGLDGTGRLE